MIEKRRFLNSTLYLLLFFATAYVCIFIAVPFLWEILYQESSLSKFYRLLAGLSIPLIGYIPLYCLDSAVLVAHEKNPGKGFWKVLLEELLKNPIRKLVGITVALFAGILTLFTSGYICMSLEKWAAKSLADPNILFGAFTCVVTCFVEIIVAKKIFLSGKKKAN